MNLRELAKRDAALTIEGAQSGNTACVLTSPAGQSWEVPMLLSDIGYSQDTDGNTVAGRTCWATYIADRVQDDGGAVLTPRNGWRLAWTDIDGRPQQMFVLFAEPDRTVGWTKLFLSVRLETVERVPDAGGDEENEA